MNLSRASSAPGTAARRTYLFEFHARELALFALAIVGLSIPFWLPTSPDYYWHLKTGELIAKHGIIYHDVFSFTANGKAWLNHEWLSQVVIYGFHDTFGYPGSVLFFGAIGTFSVGVVFWLLKKLEVPELVALTLCFAVLMLSLPFWVVRPATFSILLTAIFLASTYLYRRGKLSALWHLPPLMVLWANLHGGYVVGLGLIGLLGLCELGDRRFDRAKYVALVLVAAFLLAGVNPYTYRLWLYPFTYFVGDNASIALISEWQSPPFFHYLGTVPLGLTVLALVVFGTGGRRFDLWRTGLVVTFTALTLQSVRHQAEFSLIAPVVLGEVLVERWPNFGRVPRIRAGAFTSNAHLVIATLLAFMAVNLVINRGIQTGHEPRTTLAALSFPAAGTEFVAQRYPNARMYNEYAWGGYLIKALYPNQRVFVDGRADLYGKAILKDYQKVHLLMSGWDDVLDRYGIDLVIYERESSLASILRVDPRWQEVFTGPVESVFVRISKSSTNGSEIKGSTLQGRW